MKHEAARIVVDIEGIVTRYANGLKSIMKRVRSFLTVFWRKCKKVLRRKFKKRHTRYKLDLKRIKIQHQVTCRKPKHLIKKII